MTAPATKCRRFDIPASRLADAEKLVTRFARKAGRLGMTPPTIATLRTYSRIWIENLKGKTIAGPFEAVPHVYIADKIGTSATAMVEVEITGERPVIAGWRFAAVIESTEAGNILRKHPDHEGDLPARFRACESACDHCDKDRRRSQTFIVQAVDSGEYRQVGRSCLKDFVGAADPAAWMACYAFERAIDELGHDFDGGGGGGTHVFVLVPVFLAAVAADIRVFGYTSAKNEFKLATGKGVFSALTSSDYKDRKPLLDAITDEDRKTADAAVAWIQAPEAGDTDYVHNVRIYATLAEVTRRGCNTLASLIQAYRKHLGIKAEKATKFNEHLPGVAVKQRVRRLDATLVGDPSYDNGYDIMWILRFEDADGRCIVWRTSKRPAGVEIGTRVFITGTVRALGEYNGTKQTEMTRCKVSLHMAVDDSAPTCSGIKTKRAAKCPAQKKVGEAGLTAPLAPLCDDVGDDYQSDERAAYSCAA